MSLGPEAVGGAVLGTDLRLLGSVAAQTGLALENSRLTAQVAAEVAEREKRQREIEIAREVQERLFPQDYPPVPGLDTPAPAARRSASAATTTISSPLDDGRLGIAIGDVSGKGIPAALLMARLRASLRGQTIAAAGDLAAADGRPEPARLRELGANRYATFFYAEYDPPRGALDYVNAGHNPPMRASRRRDGAPDVVRLDTGGPVIGLLPRLRLRAGRGAARAPGDLLVAFTDGISEAMNAARRGVGRGAADARSCAPARAEPPATLIARMMAAADAFVAGAPQHDDMTLVVLAASEPAHDKRVGWSGGRQICEGGLGPTQSQVSLIDGARSAQAAARRRAAARRAAGRHAPRAGRRGDLRDGRARARAGQERAAPATTPTSASWPTSCRGWRWTTRCRSRARSRTSSTWPTSPSSIIASAGAAPTCATRDAAPQRGSCDDGVRAAARRRHHAGPPARGGVRAADRAGAHGASRPRWRAAARPEAQPHRRGAGAARPARPDRARAGRPRGGAAPRDPGGLGHERGARRSGRRRSTRCAAA